VQTVRGRSEVASPDKRRNPCWRGPPVHGGTEGVAEKPDEHMAHLTVGWGATMVVRGMSNEPIGGMLGALEPP